jgi:hypothetical protein
MAISQGMCDNFKVQILSGQQNLISGATTVYKIALYTNAATLSNSTANYTSLNEVSSSGSNYTAGGNTLTISTSPTNDGNIAYMSFANSSWTNANITANGALIYNSTANTAVASLAFGGDKTATNGTFTVIFPAANATSAIIRIA